MPRDRTDKRIAITLACESCKSRNYKTTKRRQQQPLELSKYCKGCGKHTVHRETK
jgi:large subunit ribosomal protein L33